MRQNEVRIKGKLINLEEYSRDKCHDFYKTYIADPQMTENQYTYCCLKVDHYYEAKTQDKNRVLFAIMLEKTVIGEIQLKGINFNEKHATMSIILANDTVKNKGYGTEAEKLILDYATKILNLHTIYADAVMRNSRSMHVLEKVGFKHIEDKDGMSFYKFTFIKDNR